MIIRSREPSGSPTWGQRETVIQMVAIKVCGITRMEDALLAASVGVSALGFVFWPGSPRYVEPEAAQRIIGLLPPMIAVVGVFVNQPLEDVRRIAAEIGLTAVQLHGAETADYWNSLSPRVIKAVPLSSRADADAIGRYPREVTLLLDAHDPVRYGGTGRTIDWRVAAAIAATRPVILSGGLRPDNVAAAIQQVRPYGVDVSSGVEQQPGVKDASRLQAFVRAARGVQFDRHGWTPGITR